MILTDDFVFLHVPKTGGTFVWSILRQLYPGGWRHYSDVLRGRHPGTPATVHRHKHAPRSAIPASHSHLPILATIRSPHESYVSLYEFGEWRKGRREPDIASFDWDRIERDFPHFPELSFGEFLAVFGQVGYRIDTPDRPGLGWQTVRIANQLAPGPAPDVRSSDSDLRQAVTTGTRDLHVVHTENLNQELYDTLGEIGVPVSRRQFILGAGKVLPTKGGRTADQVWRGYYDDVHLDLVCAMDSALFERFPEYTDVPR